MIIKTKDFQEICKTIALAVDGQAANLELITKENYLYLNVTNKEYFVSVKFEVDTPETIHAVIEAPLFLNLISGITTDTLELSIKGNTIIIISGKSKYKLAMIYENDTLMTLPVIKIENKTVEMPIDLDILKSIINVNSKELLKLKNTDIIEVKPAHKLYYITNEGCFTRTTGACLNSFTLEKPIQMLLNDRIVKLFKLFKTDVTFSMGHDMLANSSIQTKIVLETSNIYLAAIITNAKELFDDVLVPYMRTKTLISEKYANNLVLSVPALSAAISRLMLFAKNSIDKVNMLAIPCNITINNSDLTITDMQENSEVITIENGSYVDSDYNMTINLADIKLVLDSCKEDHITLNCGNKRAIVITRGPISNLIPEVKRD